MKKRKPNMRLANAMDETKIAAFYEQDRLRGISQGILRVKNDPDHPGSEFKWPAGVGTIFVPRESLLQDAAPR